ncbi:hypothetical protein Aple_013820 [Acrocarpospora pleiomorpha]|uniref:MSMEG_0570 family nitrogen starvation response protein n=1 Tax=Acrocarpospora pleiomorpha TaxID=90975 RepID=A0A5M3X9U8_9ACTN|nr:MSMEG_0570 family nitrogen starvation response protein [Acrocarpospora pleiomorpha]GES18487.1 hypothetical protein Aple_013820 [Acrocarpospora pleiomorpha]
MPEIYFRVRWPDGSVQRCYSPSLVVEEYLSPGQAYPTADFVARCENALRIASDRVAAKYGFACTAAAQQLTEIVEKAAGQPGDVLVEGFER